MCLADGQRHSGRRDTVQQPILCRSGYACAGPSHTAILLSAQDLPGSHCDCLVVEAGLRGLFPVALTLHHLMCGKAQEKCGVHRKRFIFIDSVILGFFFGPGYTRTWGLKLKLPRVVILLLY